jgi:signal transduction histidine kinase
LQLQPTAECPRGGCATGRLWVVQTTRPVDAMLAAMRATLLRSSVLVLVLGLILAVILAQRLVRPLRALEATIRAATPGKADVKAAVDEGPQELRTIAAVFNELQDTRARFEQNLKDQVRERTEQLEHARAQAVDAAQYKTQFMTRVSHDMRMPLVVIRDWAQKALHELAFGGDVHSIEESLRRIVNRAERLIEQVQQIVALLRTNALPAENSDAQILDLPWYFSQRRQDFELLARRNDNKVTWHVDSGRASVDEATVTTILENLLDNAAKYTVRGTIAVTLALRDSWLVISVADSGSGIAEDSLPFVWDDFRRGAAPGDPVSGDGFGLGLAIVRRLVDQRGGLREIRSAPGVGTTVQVSLPCSPLPRSGSSEGRVGEQDKVD